MSIRRQAREYAMQFVFQADLNPADDDQMLPLFWRERGASAQTREFAERLIRGVHERLGDIDAVIRRCVSHWDLERIGFVDRSILRVALFEIMFCPDIPPAVSIDEAIEIAKKYGTPESSAFVNGVLDRAMHEVGRSPRDNQVKPVS